MRVGLLRTLDDWDSDTERDVLVHVLLPTLVVELDSGLRDADALDAKIGGALALAFAAIGLLVTIHNSLSSRWVAPAMTLGIAVIVLLYCIWPRKYHLGPDGLAFYTDTREARRSPVQAAQQMAGDLIDAIRFNHGLQHRKARAFKIGLSLVLLGLVGCVLVAGFRDGAKKGAIRHAQAQPQAQLSNNPRVGEANRPTDERALGAQLS